MADNFPIRDRCSPNWLIILTAGDNVGDTYTSSKAVKRLYDYTDAKKNSNTFTRLKDPKAPIDMKNLEAITLFKPIRTMVIGFVDQKDPDVKTLVDELNLMADYGDDGENNGSAKAYFANNVPELMKALREVLGVVTAELKDISVSTRSAVPHH